MEHNNQNTQHSNQGNQSTSFERPQRVDSNQYDELMVKKNSEAFLNLASKIPENEPVVEPIQEQVPYTQEQAPHLQAEAHLNSMEKAQTNSLNIGPSYMEALGKLGAIDNTKAIQVQLPISKKTIEMTSFNGAEEQSFKTASVSPEGFLKKLNELLFNHTVFNDGSRPTFNDFLSGLYPPDKATLIWGLISASYVVLPDVERECHSCGESYIIKSAPKDLMHEDTFENVWDQPLSPEEFTVKQEVFDGFITFEFGLPSEKDRIIITNMIHPESAKDNISREGSMMSQLDVLTFFTRSITVGEPGQQTVLTNLMQDIYPFLKNLSPKVADGVRSVVDLSIFDKYMPTFYVNATCDKCGVQEEVVTDIELVMFRKSLSI